MRVYKHKWLKNRKSTLPHCGWSLRQCEWCGKVEAVPTDGSQEKPPSRCPKCLNRNIVQDSDRRRYCIGCGYTIALQVPTMTKREFYRSQKLRIRYTREEKAPIIAYAKVHGLGAASRKFKTPLATVGSWMKGQSPYPLSKKRYTEEFKRTVLNYLEQEQNLKKTSRHFAIPRSTVQNWRATA